MNISFDGKVVIITGAAGGIGRGMVHRFAEDGACVAVCDLRGAVEFASQFDDKVKGYEFDITDREATKAAIAQIYDDFGRIDVLINNAGINVCADDRFPVDKFSDKWWDAILSVDVDGTFNCTKVALSYMKEGANIINVSSIAGMVPLRKQCAFTAAKAGVINFTKAIAMELAPRGIRANTICPGSTAIPLTNLLWQQSGGKDALLSHIPMGCQATPAVIASATAFLASDYASYITGAVLPIDGGWICGGFVEDEI